MASFSHPAIRADVSKCAARKYAELTMRYRVFPARGRVWSVEAKFPSDDGVACLVVRYDTTHPASH